jgi:adenylylsulfate kinase-like enzyme
VTTARSKTDPTDCQAVLLTGVYGAGKSSVAAEMADELERRGMPYAAIDLDWLRWFDVGWDDSEAARRVMIANLEAVTGNYLAAGVRFLALALSIEHPHELEAIREAVGSPLRVVRLVVDIETIERRSADDPTSGRAIDIEWARRWFEDDTGAGLEDFAVANDRPLPLVAAEVIDRLGW